MCLGCFYFKSTSHSRQLSENRDEFPGFLREMNSGREGKMGGKEEMFFCYPILVRELPPIFHVRNVHLPVTSYMQQTRSIFFLEISFVMCMNLIAQPFLRQSWQLCPHCCLPRRRLAAKATQSSSQDFLLVTNFVFYCLSALQM